MKIKNCISVALSVCILAVTLNCMTFSASAAEIKTAYVDATGVSVRTSASTSASKIDSISYREVTVTGTSGDWLKVEYTVAGAKKSGYILYNSDYIYLASYNLSNFETMLNSFPASYRPALTALHNKYPNWTFIPDTVHIYFDYAVSLEEAEMRKQVSGSSHPISWRSMGKGAYDWNTSKWVFTNGGWTGASREIIAYYMDPRNFLNDSEIYAFLNQNYNTGTYTEAGLKQVVAGTFLAGTYTDSKDSKYGGSYVKVILEAAKQSGVSPYIIASKIIQEQGSSGSSSLISGKYSGYEGYYNFFNFGASGSNTTAVIKNGLARAKTEGWNTRSASIIGGAKKYIQNYIEIGQNTYYYQDFNVHYPQKALWHQYAQAVHDAVSKGSSLKKVYAGDSSSKLTFRIPVYLTMPTNASPVPAKTSNKNNYYFTNISLPGLTPSFSMYQYRYDLRLTDDAMLKYTLPANSSYVSATEFPLKAGANTVKLQVKSQSGFLNTYTISVQADKACTLYVDKPSVSSPQYRLGDVNSDGKISISDIGNIRLQLLGRYALSGNAKLAADVNKDGKISISDIGNIRLHLLGRYTIKD